jgi:hypothetical protein
VDGFQAALIIAAALCLVTGVVSFVLPGRGPSPPHALTADEEEDLEVLMKEEAEMGGAGLVAGEEPLAAGPEQDRP